MTGIADPSSSSASGAIAVITDRIVQKFHPEQVILFGSHARGDADADSDIDLLVVLSSISDRRKAAADVRRALLDVVEPTDVIVTTPEEIMRRGHVVGSILRPALREGKVLYERP